MATAPHEKKTPTNFPCHIKNVIDFTEFLPEE